MRANILSGSGQLIPECNEVRSLELFICLTVPRQVDQVAGRRDPRQSHPITLEQVEEVPQIGSSVDVAAAKLESNCSYTSAPEHLCRSFENAQFVSLHVQLEEVNSSHPVHGAIIVDGFDGDALAQPKLDVEVAEPAPSQGGKARSWVVIVEGRTSSSAPESAVVEMDVRSPAHRVVERPKRRAARLERVQHEISSSQNLERERDIFSLVCPDVKHANRIFALPPCRQC